MQTRYINDSEHKNTVCLLVQGSCKKFWMNSDNSHTIKKLTLNIAYVTEIRHLKPNIQSSVQTTWSYTQGSTLLGDTL